MSQKVKERPILFSGPMVRAILEGRKTQTRRVVKPRPFDVCTFRGRDNSPTGEYGLCLEAERVITKHVRCPYGSPGNMLWVRETWQLNEDNVPIYLADDIAGHVDSGWSPSIFMPRWASRITLEITAVRVERLQDIGLDDAMAEGCEPHNAGQDAGGTIKTYRTGYVYLWDKINGKKHPWESNPWVWVIEFKQV